MREEKKTAIAIRNVVKFGDGCLAISLPIIDCKKMGIKYKDKIYIEFRKV